MLQNALKKIQQYLMKMPKKDLRKIIECYRTYLYFCDIAKFVEKN